jgi:hypothetical protein
VKTLSHGVPRMNDFTVKLIIFAVAILLSLKPILGLVQAVVDDSIDVGLAIICFVCWCGLIILMLNENGWVELFYFCVFCIIALSLTSIGNSIRKLQIARMDKAMYDNYFRQLEEDPMNLGARLHLSKTLYRMGRLTEAIEQMDWILANYPSLGIQYRTTLTLWKKEEARKNRPETVFCDNCHESTPVGSPICIHCGADIGFGWFRGHSFHNMGEFARIWVAIIVCVIGCGMFFHFMNIFPSLILSALLISAAIGVFFFTNKRN